MHGLLGVSAMPRDRVSRVLADALRPSSRLRSLTLSAVTPPSEPRGVDVELSDGIIGSALATLMCLWSVVVSNLHCLISFDSVQPLLEACLHVQHVSDLALFFPVSQVPLLAAAVPGRPALKSVSLNKDPADAGGEGTEPGVLQAQSPSVRSGGFFRGETY